MVNDKTGGFEQDRAQSILECVAENGENWAAGNEPGSFGCHELLDRTALIADLVERTLAAHSACLANEEWYALARLAANTLHDLYQRIGYEHLSAE